MRFQAVEIESRAGGAQNEDRAGLAAPFAWVIDGATDVLPTPLTRAPSDASWFAEAMHTLLTENATALAERPLNELPSVLSDSLAASFRAAIKSPPNGPQDHPSAAAIIARIDHDAISYVSLGDCTLMIDDGDAFHHVGDDPEKAGDRWVADALKAHIEVTTTETPTTPYREHLWPMLHKARGAMNTPTGYGIFSITAPPTQFIRHGHIRVRPGTRVLLASDGVMRMVDVFKVHDARSLFEAAWTHGLATLLADLRALEQADHICRRYPRAKVSDDATALLLRID